MALLLDVRDGVEQTLLLSQLSLSHSRQSAQAEMVVMAVGPGHINDHVYTVDILLVQLQLNTINSCTTGREDCLPHLLVGFLSEL